MKKRKRKTAGPENKADFKLQVYVPRDMLARIDTICDGLSIYRSNFIYQILERSLNQSKYQKILEQEEKKVAARG